MKHPQFILTYIARRLWSILKMLRSAFSIDSFIYSPKARELSKQWKEFELERFNEWVAKLPEEDRLDIDRYAINDLKKRCLGEW